MLPLDENGLPKEDSFLATSFSGIECYVLNNAVAKYAYVYMAQSLCTDVPPFCLACIGTNNKFDSLAIMQRDLLLSHIPAMTKFNVSLPSSKWADWFFVIENVIYCVQDVVHVAVKLKSRLPKPQIMLPMGIFLPVAIIYIL